jgi:L,D-transpeptidase ErfK/SrfK
VTYSQAGETLKDIADRSELGYYEILEANPSVDPLKLTAGTEIQLPTQFILPDAPREGVVVNTAELRLYLYPEDQDIVITEPVGIGRQGWPSPSNVVTAIKDKREKPFWTVPASVHKDMLRQGINLPSIVPAGPDNPLGDHAMRLTLMGYDIHGTNHPEGVGKRVTAGCIRLSPEGVADLFDLVEIGTPVYLVDQPYKAGWSNGKLYFEAHQPLHEDQKKYHWRGHHYAKKAIYDAVPGGSTVEVDWEQIVELMDAHTGFPVAVS